VNHPRYDPALVLSAAKGLLVLAGLVALCAGCAPGRAATASPTASAPAIAVSQTSGKPDAAAVPEATGAPSAALVELPVPGHLPAVASVPADLSRPHPVLVAAHGAGGRPEWTCALWSSIVQGRAFVLCLTGSAIYPYAPREQTGYYYRHHLALGDEITAALAALAERFAGRVDLEAPAFAGFSQGAIMGALLLPHHEARFARAALVEGGYGLFQEWYVAVAQRFHERGGKRVLLACGRIECALEARNTAWQLVRGGLEARVVYARGAGHSVQEPMATELQRAFAWLTAGDSRW